MEYLQAGAYIAIMLAVLGVPQMLSGYFDHRARRLDRLELREERRQDAELAERRHQELMALILAAMNNGRNQRNDQDQSELIRTLQQTVAELEAENARTRQQNGNDNSSV